MSAPRVIALILGSRELQATDAAEHWALGQIAEWLDADALPALVMTTDGRGTGRLVRRYAAGARIPCDVWTLRGEIVAAEPVTLWWRGEIPDDRRWPLRRAATMIARAESHAAAGDRVRVLVLRAPWDPGGGERWTADIARKARLDVTELECPAAYGPTLNTTARGGSAQTNEMTTTEGAAR